MRILCIIRTSTLQQELDSQHSEMELFCRSLGYSDIVWLEAKGASARSLNKVYLELLEEVKVTILRDSTINAVGLWHLNRLGRKEKYLVDMKVWFIEHNINVYIKNPNITLFSDGKVNQMASMFWNMLSVSIEIDTEELMAKTKRGKIHNKELGKFNGGAFGALWGYKVDAIGYISPDAEEVYTISDIFSMYASGKYSYKTLSKELMERGITARGRKITDNVIRKTLHCEEYYRGNSRYKPIIDKETWEKVQKVTETNTSVQSKTSKHIYMGNKIVKCHLCGYNYTPTNTSYVCYAKAHGYRLEKPCKDSPSIDIGVMDKVLLRVAKLYHIDYLSQIDTNALKEEEKKLQVLVEKQKEAETELSTIKDKLSRLREIYVEGEITRQEYNYKAEGIKARQKALNEARAAYMVEQVSVGLRIHAIKNPSPESYIAIFENVDNEDNKETLYKIVRQHIKEAWIEKCIFMQKKCIKIHIKPFNGGESIFYYFYTKSKGEVYEETRNGLSKI